MVARKISAPSLQDLLRNSIDFPEGLFHELEQLLQSERSLDPSEPKLDGLAEQFGVDANNLRYFAAFVIYLYAQLEGLKPEDIRPTIIELLSENEIDDPEGVFADRLSSILSFRQQHDSATKRDRLTKGFLPFLVGTSSFVDRRADFDRNEEKELTGIINGYVTIAQLMLFTDAMNEAERTFVVQLDRNATEQLAKTLQEIIAKMDIVERSI